MMYDVLIRFKIIKSDEYIEVVFDSRLSFKENFKLLNNISPNNYKDIVIYDPNKKIFLDTNISLSSFNINEFMTFNLY